MTCSVPLTSWTSHLVQAELLQGGDDQGAEGGLHLVEQSAPLQDLLLQSLEVVNMAHHVAAMMAGEGAVGNLSM